TFTIAMSRTTMNWTALRSVSASHLRRSVATMRVESFRLRREGLQSNRDTLLFASLTFTTASWIAMIQGMAKHYDQYCPVAHALELKPVMRELALWGARSLGPPTAADEFFPGWLVCPVDMILGPIAPAGRFEFRVGDEIAALVDGVAYTGPIDDPDVVVEGDA